MAKGERKEGAGGRGSSPITMGIIFLVASGVLTWRVCRYYSERERIDV
jgi:hypothetical protein